MRTIRSLSFRLFFLRKTYSRFDSVRTVTKRTIDKKKKICKHLPRCIVGAQGRRSVGGPWSRIGVADRREQDDAGRTADGLDGGWSVVGRRDNRLHAQRTTVPRQLADLACPPAHIYMCLWSDDAPPRPRGETRGYARNRGHTHAPSPHAAVARR